MLKTNNFENIYNMINQIFNNKRFISNLDNIKVNWLDISSKDVINCILEYMKEFEKVTI